MRDPSLARRARFAWAPLLALWASLPALMWCPPELERACSAMFARCAMAQAVTPAEAGCRSCPLAQTRATSATHHMCGGSSGCPMAMAGPAAGTSAPRHAASPHRRLFCVGDPNGGLGVSTHATQHPPGPGLVATLPASPPEERGAPRELLTPQREGRPPPAPWSRRPPARAPPSYERT